MTDLKFTTAGEYMNKFLHQLKQQAGIQDNPDQEGLDIFAGLIVEECVRCINIAASKYTNETWLKASIEDIGYQIQERFGVEQ